MRANAASPRLVVRRRLVDCSMTTSSRLSEQQFRRSWRSTNSRLRLAVMATVGIITAVATGLAGTWQFAPVAGWGVAALVYGGWVWLAVGRMNADQTRTHATREDPSRASTEVLVISASIVSLGAVGLVLAEASSAKGAAAVILAGSAIISVALSWLLIHTLFTLRYALLYYTGPPDGIDFNQDDPPRYTDFAYVSFTLGMTFQVSDTDLKTHRIRATALRHALLSYLFGAVILATTINLVAGLSSSGH